MRPSLADQLAKLKEMKDEDIDTSDIPEATEEWFAEAQFRRRANRKTIEQNPY
jgi:hypothetical protein